ncbi:MAG TPA: hypothetical protein VF921_17110 [Vicinamibacterales bacterium]
MTPEDRAATTTLLRAPAAVVAAAFLVGVIAGAAVSSYRAGGPAIADALPCLAAGFVCVPFLVPSECYRPARTGMRAWLPAAAFIASIRTAWLCVSLYPARPSLGNWLMAAGLQVALAGTLWLAVFAVLRRDPTLDPGPSAAGGGARGAASG